MGMLLSRAGSGALQSGEYPVGLDTIAICCSKFLHSVRSKEHKLASTGHARF